jgi:hypothetical protein
MVAGRAAAAAGDPRAAEAALELAVRQAEEAGTPYERALALGAAADRLEGRPSQRATAMRAESRQILAQLGAPAVERSLA